MQIDGGISSRWKNSSGTETGSRCSGAFDTHILFTHLDVPICTDNREGEEWARYSKEGEGERSIKTKREQETACMWQKDCYCTIAGFCVALFFLRVTTGFSYKLLSLLTLRHPLNWKQARVYELLKENGDPIGKVVKLAHTDIPHKMINAVWLGLEREWEVRRLYINITLSNNTYYCSGVRRCFLTLSYNKLEYICISFFHRHSHCMACIPFTPSADGDEASSGSSARRRKLARLFACVRWSSLSEGTW